ncbi:MAG: hypothetical protein FRX49_04695 [Trebouxia sp. A1-2]|nr:MAG: hypothetical protein FRX49_04695 [Trebouxia sp. A1-2]
MSQQSEQSIQADQGSKTDNCCKFCRKELLPKSALQAWRVEAGNVETDRSLRSLLSARRSEEDMSALMHGALHPQARKQHAWEPMTPQEAAEGNRLFPSQAWLLSHTMTASFLCYVIFACTDTYVLQLAAARGIDDIETVETEVMQKPAFAHQASYANHYRLVQTTAMLHTHCNKVPLFTNTVVTSISFGPATLQFLRQNSLMPIGTSIKVAFQEK